MNQILSLRFQLYGLSFFQLDTGFVLESQVIIKHLSSAVVLPDKRFMDLSGIFAAHPYASILNLLFA